MFMKLKADQITNVSQIKTVEISRNQNDMHCRHMQLHPNIGDSTSATTSGVSYGALS